MAAVSTVAFVALDLHDPLALVAAVEEEAAARDEILAARDPFAEPAEETVAPG